MPKISPLKFDPLAISLSVERETHRSKGIHLSAIIRDRLITAGIERKVKGGKSFTPEETHMLFQQGFLWERMVAEYIETPENRQIEWEWFVTSKLDQLVNDTVMKSGGDIVRPGEVQFDGIYMTPDAINIRLGHIEEWKSTGIRSSNLDIQSRKPEWLWQTAAYAKCFGYTRGIIRVWHYCQMPATVSQWTVEWTQEEIDTNWNHLMEHYRFMRYRTDGKV